MPQSEADQTILIIDDDPDLLPSLIATVEVMSDFAVVSATNGALGLERFFEVRPHCVLIDVRMPELDGFQFVRAIRGDPESASTPLIILTALAQDQARFVGMASGVDQYLVKPVKPHALMEAIRLAVRNDAENRRRQLENLAEIEHPAPEGEM